jgi:hypothetical protein
MNEFGRIFQPICYLEEYQIQDSFVPASTNFREFFGICSGFVRLPPKPSKRTVEQYTNSIPNCPEPESKASRTISEQIPNSFRSAPEELVYFSEEL